MTGDPISIFFSYSRKDEALMRELESHLEPLRLSRLIESWHDGCITPGEEWEPQSEPPRCAPLAGKNTLNRLEQAMPVCSDLADSRYIKMSLNPKAVETLLVEFFPGKLYLSAIS